METIFITGILLAVGFYLYFYIQEKKKKSKSSDQISKQTPPTAAARLQNLGRKQPVWAKQVLDAKEALDSQPWPAGTTAVTGSSEVEKSILPPDQDDSYDEATETIDPKFTNRFKIEITGDWELVDDPDPIREMGRRALERMEEEISVSKLVDSMESAAGTLSELRSCIQAANPDYEQVVSLGEKLDQTNVAHLFLDDLTGISDQVEMERPGTRHELMKAFAQINAKYEAA